MRTNATAVGIVLAAALVGLSAPDATAQAGKTLKIRFGNSQGLGETTADTMADFKKEVEAKSNGQIQDELAGRIQLDLDPTVALAPDTPEDQTSELQPLTNT